MFYQVTAVGRIVEKVQLSKTVTALSIHVPNIEFKFKSGQWFVFIFVLSFMLFAWVFSWVSFILRCDHAHVSETFMSSILTRSSVRMIAITVTTQFVYRYDIFVSIKDTHKFLDTLSYNSAVFSSSATCSIFLVFFNMAFQKQSFRS